MNDTPSPLARDLVTDVFGRSGCALYAEALGRSRSSLSRIVSKQSRTAALVLVKCELFRLAAGHGLFPEVLLRQPPPAIELADGETYVTYALAHHFGEDGPLLIAEATGETRLSVASAMVREEARFYPHYLRMVIVLDALHEAGADLRAALTKARDKRIAWQVDTP